MPKTPRHKKSEIEPRTTRLAIDVSAARRFAGLNKRLLALQTRAACGALGVRTGEISIRLADDVEMGRLHKQHKGIGGPTDVLTFDFDPHAGLPAKEGPRRHVEVEIVIGAQVAQRESRRREHGAGVEALLYIVHGLLHCLGHDDHDPPQAAAMHRREDAVLRRVGVGPAYRADRRRATSSRRL